MYLIDPVTITAALIDSTDIPVDDTYSAWNGGTGYTTGQTVYVGEQRYRAVTGSTGQNPETDTTNTYWLPTEKATRYRPFDGVIGHYVEASNSLYYRFDLNRRVDTIALFNVLAETVRVRVWNGSGTLVHDETTTIVNTTLIVDWFSYFFWEPEYSQEILLTGIPGYADHEIRIDVDAGSGTARVGEIVLGRAYKLGDSVAGTSLGILDFSTVERDAFGNATVTERAYADRATYNVTVTRGDELRFKRLLAARRAKPTVFFTGATDANRGTLLYGFPKDWDIPISGDTESFATITVEGVI